MTSKINSTAFAVIKDYDAYNESRAETVEVDLFKVGSNPVRINVADCVGDRTAFRATIADKVEAFVWCPAGNVQDSRAVEGDGMPDRLRRQAF